MLPDRSGGFVDNAIFGRAPALQREVEARKPELDADHVDGQDPKWLLQELLPGLVTLEDDDRLHARIVCDRISTEYFLLAFARRIS